MTHNEVEASSGSARPQRSLYWRAVVVSGIAVVGAAVAAPMVYGATDHHPPETPAPMVGLGSMMQPAPMHQMMMSGHMMAGQTMQPGQRMDGARMTSGHMMDSAQMAEIMNSGQHMMDAGQMMGEGR
jgi:hypothetical protein